MRYYSGYYGVTAAALFIQFHLKDTVFAKLSVYLSQHLPPFKMV
jgi:hypothetical protein